MLCFFNLRKRFESFPVWDYVNGINIRPIDDDDLSLRH